MDEKDVRNIESYFRNNYLLDGKYDFPIVKKQVPDLHDLKLLRFSNAVKEESRYTDSTIHDFENRWEILCGSNNKAW
jgi:hypothetical protein